MEKGEFQERETVRPAEATELPVKKDKKAGLLNVLLLVIIIGLAAYIVVDKFLIEKEESPKCNKTECATVAADETLIDENGVKYTAEEDKKVREVVSALAAEIQSAIGASHIGVEIDTAGAGFKTADGWTTLTDRSYSIYYIGTSYGGEGDINRLMGEDDVKGILAPVFAKYNLKDKSSEYALPWNTPAFVGDDGLVCSYANGMPFSLNCGYESWVNDGNYALRKSLVAAYAKHSGETGTSTGYIYAKTDDIKKNTSGDYENIRASTGYGYGIYYRKISESEWTFVMSGNGIPACSDFNDEAQKALEGSGIGCLNSDNTDRKL